MARFRSKPSECLADQYIGEPSYSSVPGSDQYLRFNDFPEAIQWESELTGYFPYVVTIHGQKAKVTTGDWIAQEPDGVHYYPIKPEIFEKRWEETK